MSRWDADSEEMAFLRGLSSEREELILAGSAAADGADEELAELVRALRDSLPAQPPEPVTASTVPLLAAAAREAAEPAPAAPAADPRRNGAGRRRPADARRRLRLGARVAIAALSIPLLLSGLAVAGVKIPELADDAFRAVGVELPGQRSGEDTQPRSPGDANPEAAPGSGGEAAGGGKSVPKRAASAGLEAEANRVNPGAAGAPVQPPAGLTPGSQDSTAAGRPPGHGDGDKPQGTRPRPVRPGRPGRPPRRPGRRPGGGSRPDAGQPGPGGDGPRHGGGEGGSPP